MGKSAVGVMVLRGAVQREIRCGYGDGYGFGYGVGYGVGYGDGYGYGVGYGDGDLVGYGVGFGYGFGYGVGYGYGDGDGYGFGDGFGDRYGFGDLVVCSPRGKITVTAEQLERAGACAEVVATFKRVFPGGGMWPDDIDKAEKAGFDIDWCRRLGLLKPIPGSHTRDGGHK